MNDIGRQFEIAVSGEKLLERVIWEKRGQI